MESFKLTMIDTIPLFQQLFLLDRFRTPIAMANGQWIQSIPFQGVGPFSPTAMVSVVFSNYSSTTSSGTLPLLVAIGSW